MVPVRETAFLINTGVIARSDSHQFCLHAIAYIQSLDKLMNGLLCHMGIGAGKRLQCLVWMWISLTTKDGLDSLSYYSPGIIQVFLQLLFMKDELTQALQCALDGDDAMTERHTDVTEYGTVSKVALQAANRKFLCQDYDFNAKLLVKHRSDGTIFVRKVSLLVHYVLFNNHLTATLARMPSVAHGSSISYKI